MGCLIHYAVRDGMLQAVVSGRTLGRRGSGHADWIARDIADEAGRQTVRRVLIDLRGLTDRLGSLGVLSMGQLEGRRVRGCVLKCFSSAAEALRWLRSTPGFH